MVIYGTVPPAEHEPVVFLKNWGFMKDKYGHRLVGFNATPEYRERLSSAVDEVNPADMTARTRCGRLYHLIGPEDPATAAKLVEDHLARWGLADDDAVFVPFDAAIMWIRWTYL